MKLFEIISSFEIIKVVIPEPSIFFLILPSIADMAADIPNGANTFLANGTATFINGPANFPNRFPKNPPDYIIFDNRVFDNLISIDVFLAKALRIFATCLLVNNNS